MGILRPSRADARQLGFDFFVTDFQTPLAEGDEVEELGDPLSYDVAIVALSGGKDSVACLLHLLELGYPADRIECWHHDVDGREGPRLMDWPCTASYCRRLCDALGVTLRFSWREGGFLREMLRTDAPTAAMLFETEDGSLGRAGGKSEERGTRRRFPQVSADLAVRWCSGSLKISVGLAALTGQDRFLGRRVLFVTGERAEESPGRARYRLFEPHKTDTRNGTRRRRHVDHWRPVHGWKEAEVWAIMERRGVLPHPCYRLGWSRASCAACVFSADRHWASLAAVLPEQFALVAGYEAEFGVSIARDRRSVAERAAAGRRFDMDAETIEEARDPEWNRPVLLPPEEWKTPLGAYGGSDGGPC